MLRPVNANSAASSQREQYRLSARGGRIELRLLLPGMPDVNATAAAYDVRDGMAARLKGLREEGGYRVLRNPEIRLAPQVYVVEFQAGGMLMRQAVRMPK